MCEFRTDLDVSVLESEHSEVFICFSRVNWMGHQD